MKELMGKSCVELLRLIVLYHCIVFTVSSFMSTSLFYYWAGLSSELRVIKPYRNSCAHIKTVQSGSIDRLYI